MNRPPDDAHDPGHAWSSPDPHGGMPGSTGSRGRGSSNDPSADPGLRRDLGAPTGDSAAGGGTAAASELLSAYLDGELGSSERRLVERALTEDPDLRDEFAEIESVRSLLRALPEVRPRSRHRSARVGDAPMGVSAPEVEVFGLVSTPDPAAMDRRDVRGPGAGPGAAAATGAAQVVALSTRRRRLLPAVAVAAAVWLLVLAIGVSVGDLPVVPDVDALAVRHASAEPMDFAPMNVDEMDDPAVVADLGHGMNLDAVFARGEVVQARYSDGAADVSVFHQPGRVDWHALPDGGEMVQTADGQGWQATMDDTMVLVVERGDLIVTVVADASMDDDMVMAAPMMIPPMEDDPPLWRRILDAPGNLVDRL